MVVLGGQGEVNVLVHRWIVAFDYGHKCRNQTGKWGFCRLSIPIPCHCAVDLGFLMKKSPRAELPRRRG
jgi:hypothetical protein